MSKLALSVPAKDVPWIANQTTMSFLAFRNHQEYQDLCAKLDPWYVPRAHGETDPTFLQIVPYITVTQEDQVFLYARGGNSEEARLTNKMSIGLGGHIEYEDGIYTGKGLNTEQTIRRAMERELGEEANVDQEFASRAAQFTGLIYDPTTEVGRVHLGVAITIELTGDIQGAYDEGIDGGTMVSWDFVDRDVLEPWSRIMYAQHRGLI